VSLSLVWDIQSSAGGVSTSSSWCRSRWLRPSDRPPTTTTAVDSDVVGLLQRLKRRLDRQASQRTEYQATSGEETAPGGRGRGLLRRCLTSLNVLRVWRARRRHSQSSPSLFSDRPHATTKQLQQQQQHQLPAAVLRQQTGRSTMSVSVKYFVLRQWS